MFAGWQVVGDETSFYWGGGDGDALLVGRGMRVCSVSHNVAAVPGCTARRRAETTFQSSPR